jgi:NAD(P)-dependent dehydrogenase (short-subunit alcohol dehydrogenase family)
VVFILKRVALITGTSSGFGLGTTIALAQKGCFVIAAMRDLTKRGRLLEAAEQAGVSERIEVVQLDVTVPPMIESLVDEVIDRHGRIDVLINNAGYAAGGFVEELPLEEWRRQFETNVFGLIAVTRAVLPHMRAQRSGTIINVSSISGRIGFPGLAPYSASKHAVEGFSESLRLEMLPHGVHVVLIEPGSYRTSIWEKGLEQTKDLPASPYREQMKRMTALIRQIANKTPEPDEVIDTIVQAATSARPRLRYPVGKGVRFTVVGKQLLPWRWFESLVARYLGSPFSRRS